MQLMEKLNQDMKDAMRAKEAGKLRLSVIRMIKSAAKYAEIEKGGELSDEDLLAVIAKELKSRRDVLPEYEKNDRQDTAETLRQEIAILLDYLPKQMDEAEIRALAAETIAAVGAAGPKDMGKVMGALNKATGGNFDKAAAAKEVGSRLA